MDNDNTDKVNRYAFLDDRKMPRYFAKLDYFLRSGVHVQREYPSPKEIYRFLDDHYNNGIKEYYQEIFQLPLTKAGNEFNQYYYIDLSHGERSNVSSDFKDYLKPTYILIGLLFLKLHKIDGNLELNTTSEFIHLLFQEYEEEKLALTQLITDSGSEKATDRNDEKVEGQIKRAFDKFGELGWILWSDPKEKETFKMLPSFERLRIIYQDQIENIDQVITKFKNEDESSSHT